MDVGDEKKRQSSCSRLCCCTKRFPTASSLSSSKSSSSEKELEEKSNGIDSIQRKPGWKAMPYVLGNETFERLGTYGLTGNFMVYLRKKYHMEQVYAANIINIWAGTSNFLPLIGAFISDACVGKFWTIAVGSFGALLGMVILTLTASVPQLLPPPCTQEQELHGQCIPHTKAQLGVLVLGVCCLSIGTAGIRPCSVPFGVDQFDTTTEEGRKGITSFFNWYYTTFTVVMLISQTVVVYIQENKSWAWGFGLSTVLMIFAIILFFVGRKIYVYVKPDGSMFSSIIQVFIAAYKKRKILLPADGEADGVFYDPAPKGIALSKLSLTKQFSFLNKAAIIEYNELKADGSCMNKWRLCSIQQIEEVKCLINIAPIWASGIICLISLTQERTFTVSQAQKMDRHLGPSFQVPAGSLGAIALLTIGIWLPIYDRIIVPTLEKITKHEGGITLLQRIGVGNVFSFLSMVIAGLVERKRRASAILHAHPDGVAPMSFMWLAPQLILMGLFEAFSIIGQMEFYSKQFPEHMRSIGNSMIYLNVAGASYVSSLVITIVHHVTGKQGHPDWLANDANVGRIDYYYFLIAGLVALNFIFFLFCAHYYRYKACVQVEAEPHLDVDQS